MSQIQAFLPQISPYFQASFKSPAPKVPQFGMAIADDGQDRFTTVKRGVARQLGQEIDPKSLDFVPVQAEELEQFIRSFKGNVALLSRQPGSKKIMRDTIDPQEFVTHLAKWVKELQDVQAAPDEKIMKGMSSTLGDTLNRKLDGCWASLAYRVEEAVGLMTRRQLFEVMDQMEAHSVVFPKQVTNAFTLKLLEKM